MKLEAFDSSCFCRRTLPAQSAPAGVKGEVLIPSGPYMLGAVTLHPRTILIVPCLRTEYLGGIDGA